MTDGPAAARPGSPVRTVFLGSGAFAVPILQALAGAPETRLVGVVTAPARPAGRKGELRSTPVAETAAAEGLGVPVLTPERLRAAEAVAAILDLRPELAVLADYGQIVPADLLELRHGALNLHPSLLPRHRGATPIPATILAGDRETGVTLIRMDEGLDTGPIVAAVSWPLKGRETGPDLEARAADAAAALLAASLGGWLRGELPARPQPLEGATLTRPLRRADGRLDPDRPAAELERQVRAYLPWPGSWLDSPIGRLAVHAASVAPSEPGDMPGALVALGDGLALATTDGRLELRDVQPAGGRRMSGADLRRGRPGVLAS